MQTRITRLILLAFSLQAFSLSPALPAQLVRQPSPADDTPAPGAAAPTVNRKLEPVNSTPTAAPADDEVVELSEFVVTGAMDDGYAAANTASGSRINTPLKDVAASINVFTEEFLNDIGAESLDDILSYVGNVEISAGDDYGSISGDDAFSDPVNRSAGSDQRQFRIRGIPATTLVDGVVNVTPHDQYNLGRVEVQNGANSILFGIGSQGGVVAQTSKRANLRRNTTTIKNTIGFWEDSPVNGIPYQRTTLDYNLVLARGKMALRLNALYLNNKNWRYWEFADDKRIAPAFAAKPFKNTTIHINGQIGRRQSSSSNDTGFLNAYADWMAAATNPDGTVDPSKLVMTGFEATDAERYLYQLPGTNLERGNTWSNRNQNWYVFVGGGQDQVYNYRRAFRTVQPDNIHYPISTDRDAFNYSRVGPGAKRDQKFRDFQVSIEQRIGKLNFELSYLHSRNDSYLLMPQSALSEVRGDPNQWISPPYWGGNDMSSRIVNPNAGRLYLQSTWTKNTSWQDHDTIRLTANYDINLKKFGRHSLIAHLEHLETERIQRKMSEVLLDDDQVGILVADNPDADRNRIRRRQYITPGDYSTYYQGDPTIPVTNMVGEDGSRLFHSAWVLRESEGSHIKTSLNSAMFAVQSYWLKNRLATIVGFRLDDVSFKWDSLARITDPNDPRILNKTRAYYEWDFANKWTSGSHKPYTFSAGAVYHLPILKNRFSFKANYSTNRGIPDLDGRTILPNGHVPELTKGTTFDYGVVFDILGNDKLKLQVVRFDTRQIGDPSIIPNGVVQQYSDRLSTDSLNNIYDALYHLRPTGYENNIPSVDSQSGWPLTKIINPDGTESIVSSGPTASGAITDTVGPMSYEQYAVREGSSPDYPWGRPPIFNAATLDVFSKGYEVSLTGNITKNFRVNFYFSWYEREAKNIMKEMFDFYNTNIPKWMEMADPDKNGGTTYYVNVTGMTNVLTSSGDPKPGVEALMVSSPTPGNPDNKILAGYVMRLDEFIWNQLYATGSAVLDGNNQSVRNRMRDRIKQLTGSYGAIPWQTRLTLTYSFPNKSVLKGLAGSITCRYNSNRWIADPYRSDDVYTMPDKKNVVFDFDPDFYYANAKKVEGPDRIMFDCMLRYKMKILGGRSNLSIQFNVTNLFNKTNLEPGSYHESRGFDEVYRYYPATAPRQIRLATTLDF